MDPNSRKRRREDALWNNYDVSDDARELAQELSDTERAVLKILCDSRGAITLFELRARAPLSSEDVGKAIRLLRAKSMLRLTAGRRGRQLVRLTKTGKDEVGLP
ncbi:MAG: hypothetical protein HOL01_21260 [Planctomycetaceae bacterium]|jgi:hypothetical protein|nr:hypothetical protein [Planctomycetaceae bacterium]MBT6484215.1 hypothetical protein [Planctomycetaceae bacterium]MBT6497068.1 hypothetical protein [Planctomycetaceae bacterium]